MEQHEQNSSGERLAIGLGLFSLGLGLAEVAAPRGVARLAGLPADEQTWARLRAIGAREIGHGVAILAQPSKPWPIWSRLGGDALDLSLLGAATQSAGADRRRATLAAAALLGVTAADLVCALQLGRGRTGAAARQRRDVRLHHVITVNKPIGEVYRFWRNFENFPSFMRHVESVEVVNGRRSFWRATAPAGLTVEWEAEIVEERENAFLSWRSVEGADVENHGSVRFEHAPGARGTEVHVRIAYHPPAGRVGRTIARLFGEEPEGQIREDLRRFKQIIETGEVPISEGEGLWRPARPVARPAPARDLGGVYR